MSTIAAADGGCGVVQRWRNRGCGDIWCSGGHSKGDRALRPGGLDAIGPDPPYRKVQGRCPAIHEL